MDTILDFEENKEIQEREYAGFWGRFLAVLIDGIILAIPEYIIVNVIFEQTYSGNGLNFVLGILYFTLFESSEKRATPGKMVMGYKVVDDETGGQISYPQALGRYFGRLLSTLIILIGYFMMLWSDKKQTLHDKLAGTVVIKG